MRIRFNSAEHLRCLGWALGLVLSVFLLYSPSLSYDFTMDDALVTSQNEDVAGGTAGCLDFFVTSFYHGTAYEGQNGNLYRPLSKLSMAMNYALAGRQFNPSGFHLANVLLYALVILAVFGFYREIFSQTGAPAAAALLAAGIFAVFPAHIESVCNIKHREELLACFFGILCWLLVIRSPSDPHRPVRCFLGAALFLAAMLSKESAILLLPCLLLFEHIQGRWRKPGFRMLCGFYAGAVILYLALRVIALGTLLTPPGGITFFSPDENLLFRAGVSSMVFLRYYLLDQLFVHQLDPAFSSRALLLGGKNTVMVAAVCLAVVVAMTVWAARSALRRRSQPGLWFLFFMISSLLTFNIIPIGTAGAFRLMFTPSVFLCALLALTLVRCQRLAGARLGSGPRRFFLPAAAALLVFWYGHATWSGMGIWRDDGAIYSYSAGITGRNPMADYAAGQYFEKTGEIEKKFFHYGRVLEILQAADDGKDLLDERTVDAFSVVATEMAMRALEADPLRAVSLAEVGIAQFRRLKAFRNGHDDDNATGPYFVKALALRNLNRTTEAAAVCREGLAIAEHQGLRALLESIRTRAE